MKSSIVLNTTKKNSFLPCSVALLFILINVNLSVAQYHPFPIDNGIWVNQERTYYLDQNNFPIYTTSWIDKYCASGNDTIINFISYKQIDFCSSISSTYHGALRYDIGQVYFVPKDSLNEFLLYDFSLNIGNTVEVIIQNGAGSSADYSFASLTINNIDTVTVNGTQRRRFQNDGSDWIEGIGSTSGLFMEPWANVSNYFRRLICMSSEDSIHYDNGVLAVGNPGICDLTLNSKEFLESSIGIELFPNPASKKINIQLSKKITAVNVTLRDVFGLELANYHFKHTDHFEVNIQNFKVGMYFLEIQTDEIEKSIIKILKQ